VAAKKKSRLTGKQIVERGERALRELELGVTTQADKNRIVCVWLTLKYLDDEQSVAKDKLDAIRAALE
jgi:hypothetical protein